MVEKAYIVTNGCRVAGVVLQESLAKHICKKTINSYEEEHREQASKEWVVCNIERAIQYAFERGFNEALLQVQSSNKMNSSCEEVSQREKLAQENTQEKNDEEGNLMFNKLVAILEES